MSNDYFNYTTELAANTLARSSAVNSRFTSVAVGFDLLPGKLKLQQNRVTYVTAGGTGDALTATLDFAPPAYVEGLHLRVKLTATNTGASTINVNSLGVKSIKRYDGTTALSAGELTSGQIVDLVYNGTNFVLGTTSSAATAAAASAAAAAASAASITLPLPIDSGGTGQTTAGAALTALGGQPLDADLTAIAGLPSAADKGIYFTGSAAAALFDLTAGGRAGLALTYAADKFVYWTSASAAATADITAGGRAGLALTYAADKIAYWTSASAAATTDLTSVARTLLAQTTQAAMRTTGLGLGTAAVAATGTSGNTLPFLDGANTFSGANDFTGGLSRNGTSIEASPINTQNAAYSLVLGDAGKTIYHSEATTARVYTIPANASVAYPVGTIIKIKNKQGSGAITLNITSDTLHWGASGTGSRTIAAGGVAIIQKMESTVWDLSGTGIS